METPLAFTFCCLLLLTPQGLSRGYTENYNYNYDDASTYQDYEEVIEDAPNFLARSQTFKVEVGQSVIIPCDVENAGVNKLIIKKIPSNGGREKLISVGSERVIRDSRIAVDGSRLTITDTRPRDAGTFLCTFEMEPPIQLKHTLDVQFAPTIKALDPPEQHVPKGSTVTLECRAQGNPEPVIRWSRQESPLPSNLPTEGNTLTLEGLDHHVEGTYLCTADNGIGESASAAMSITVDYPPEIITEKTIVRTGEGDTVELACIVKGRPSPDVTWTKDDHPLPDTDMDTKLYIPERQNNSFDSYTAHLRPAHAAHAGYAAHTTAHFALPHATHRHIFTIKNVSEKDFGAYVCIARNNYGQKEAVIQMTGMPESPQVTSTPTGGESTRYTLTWVTESYYPITDFIIKYRRSHLGAWQTNQTMVLAGSWKTVSRSVEAARGTHNTTTNTTTTHSMVFTLDDLDVATDYVAVILVRNKYGWSDESPHFSFSTKKAMAVLHSTSGARRVSTLPTILLISILATI
ncbi:lachesin [Procambarus clarkii]|uniref:lachesin n=1 Tax=Procambarus clarkii TaxID=6728 RepID=UPI0037426C76